MRPALFLALSLAQPGSAFAQRVITSAAPVASAVTIYQDPAGADSAFDAHWLRGYALVRETREVDLPAGEAVVRFEGVAAGMLAESAILSGLPAGVSEKVLDAALLSPRNLYAASFGRPVTLRRTLENGVAANGVAGNGVAHEEPAIIRSGADGAAVLETARGFEVANCPGWSDALVWHGTPEGLVTRPTLSVATNADKPVHARLTLTYLAWGFDWRARYVLAMRPDRRSADLTAWVTVASSDDTAFADAETAIVAGHPRFGQRSGNKPDDDDDDDANALTMQCKLSRDPPPPPVLAPPPVMMPPTPIAMPAPPRAAAAEILVTAMRKNAVMKAENLGDLKLFRLPQPTTVAAHAQKQVALIAPRRVKLAVIHTDWITRSQSAQTPVILRASNTRAAGLGMALPGGAVVVEESAHGVALPVGQGVITDKAVKEKVEFPAGETSAVQWRRVRQPEDHGWRQDTVMVTNANGWPVRFEGKLPIEWAIGGASARLGEADGHRIWAVTVPAHGRAVLRYRVQVRR